MTETGKIKGEGTVKAILLVGLTTLSHAANAAETITYTYDAKGRVIGVVHTDDPVLAHVESYRANIVDARAVYVAISRARQLATLYTGSRADLTEALGHRDGAQVGAIDQTMTHPKRATIANVPIAKTAKSFVDL